MQIWVVLPTNECFLTNKPIGASPSRDFVVKRMVLVQIQIEYNLVLTLSWCRDIKKGGERSAGYGLNERF